MFKVTPAKVAANPRNITDAFVKNPLNGENRQVTKVSVGERSIEIFLTNDESFLLSRTGEEIDGVEVLDLISY